MVTKTYKDFIDIITKFDPESVNQKKKLENIIFEFPYFQLAHAIYLKSLKIQDRFNFDLFLKTRYGILLFCFYIFSDFVRCFL